MHFPTLYAKFCHMSDSLSVTSKSRGMCPVPHSWQRQCSRPTLNEPSEGVYILQMNVTATCPHQAKQVQWHQNVARSRSANVSFYKCYMFIDFNGMRRREVDLIRCSRLSPAMCDTTGPLSLQRRFDLVGSPCPFSSPSGDRSRPAVRSNLDLPPTVPPYLSPSNKAFTEKNVLVTHQGRMHLARYHVFISLG